MPSSNPFYNDFEDCPQKVLERLEELSIKNLYCEDVCVLRSFRSCRRAHPPSSDDSPSFGTASLPTPEAPRADFRLPESAMHSP